MPATIARILAAGPQVKVELLGSEGETVNVELAHDRYREMKIALGDRVFVSPREARVLPKIM